MIGPGRIASGLRKSGSRDDADHSALQCALDGELHGSVNLGKQRVVLANADVVAGVHLGAALAYDDAATGNQFAAEALHAQTFGM